MTFSVIANESEAIQLTLIVGVAMLTYMFDEEKGTRNRGISSITSISG